MAQQECMQTQRNRPYPTLRSSTAAISTVGMPHAAQRLSTAVRPIAIDPAIDRHRGMPRGFLPRGLSDTCPQAGADRCLAACAGRCPTTLNSSGHSPVKKFVTSTAGFQVQQTWLGERSQRPILQSGRPSRSAGPAAPSRRRHNEMPDVDPNILRKLSSVVDNLLAPPARLSRRLRSKLRA